MIRYALGALALVLLIWVALVALPRAETGMLAETHAEGMDAARTVRSLVSSGPLSQDQFAKLSLTLATSLQQSDALLMVVDRQGVISKGTGDLAGKRITELDPLIEVDALYLDAEQARTLSGASLTFHAVGLSPGATLVLAMPAAKEQALTGQVSTTQLAILAAAALLVLVLLFRDGTTQAANPRQQQHALAKRILNGELPDDVPHTAADDEIIRALSHLIARAKENQHLGEQLLRSQKMEVIGTLAAGIAHDFNNVLGGISGALDLIRSETRSDDVLPDSEVIESMTQVAADCVRRGRDTVDRLLSFSRMDDERPEAVNVNLVVASVRKMCAHSFGKGIDVIAETLEEDVSVSSRRSDLEQALLNVCINARDAMQGEAGSLTLRVSKMGAEEVTARTGKNVASEHVVLLVRDTGAGISSENLKRIFQPFFTTKADGKGTGLGLPMAQRIAEEADGWIDVQSEQNVGTSFFFYLPVMSPQLDTAMICDLDIKPAEAAATNAPESRANMPAVSTASTTRVADEPRTILLIEDDNILRELTASHLKKCGYDILASETGEEGLKLYAEHRDSIDGVLLDLVLPGISGADVFGRLHADAPEVRVLLTSGSSDDELITKLLIDGCKGFLPKPYSLEELSSSVTNVLLTSAR